MPNSDPQFLLMLSLRVLCVGVILRSAHLLFNRRELSDRRLLGWNPAARGQKRLAWRLRLLLSHPGCVVLLVLRTALAALALFVVLPFPFAAFVTGALFLLQVWFNYRFAIVYQAADTMCLTGLGAVFAAALDPNEPRLQQAALAFLAVQVLLAYFMSGKSKVVAATWRDGSHLIEILSASAFRLEAFGAWLSRHRGAARIAATSVILFELCFPLSLLASHSFFTGVLAAGVFFHATIAFVMGLPPFFWSFAATYPAVYFLHQRLHALG